MTIPEALDARQIADSPSEPEFEVLLDMVIKAFGVSHAELSLVNPAQVWTKSTSGTPGIGQSSAHTYRTRVTAERSSLVVPAIDSDRPEAGSPGQLRFFVGIPLLTAGGEPVGALCAWDEQPRQPTTEQLANLDRLGMIAVSLLEQRRSQLVLRDRDAVLNASTAVLDLIVRGAALPTILDTLARAVEASFPATLCSIQLIEGDRLRPGAGPRLPRSFNEMVDGTPIGPAVGSCGTAAYERQPVVVTDIATDERWANWRDLALGYGLRACWSVPIIGPGGRVVGTFAQYYQERRAPTADDLVQMNRWVNLAEVAITRAGDLAALRDAATSDSLTGLMNRASVLSELQQLIDQGDRGIGLLFIDLDQFKFINDTFGHAVGDLFLQAVAVRLLGTVEADETVARFGGDEFLIVCPAVTDAEEAELRGERIIAALRQPITYAGRAISLSVSIGVALHRAAADGLAADLVGDADLAMYAAKRSGRNSVAVFSEGLRTQAAGRLSMEGALDQALADGTLDCDYQPIVEIRTGRVIALEALMRWRGTGPTEIPPSVFIPTAEESGQIFALGELALRRACRQMVKWRRAATHWRDVTLWINVSPRQLRDSKFVDLVDLVLAETGLPPTRLGLEVGETSFILDSPVAKESLKELRKKGIRVAIDDFGTGYSSLAQLRDLPVDVLKIDRQFVSDLREVSTGPGIVEAIVTLAKVLKLAVVAEGVETEVERERLISTGCAVGQGYLWSRPMRPETIEVQTAYLQPHEPARNVRHTAADSGARTAVR